MWQYEQAKIDKHAFSSVSILRIGCLSLPYMMYVNQIVWTIGRKKQGI